jgi:predicted HAD superfamily Cof-like phosphohydrolase
MEKNLNTLLPPDMLQDVADFHRRILNQMPAESPSLVSPQFLIERFRFMQEELDEFLTAGFNGDMVGAADAIADILYVALGTAHLMNLPMNQIWNVVHAANMRKVRGKTKRNQEYDAVKPEGWVGPEPEIAKAIGEALG